MVRMIMVLVGAVVKYNPCSVYARLGKSCIGQTEHRFCASKFGPCSDEEYDLWFKRVVEGEIKYFYPKRIRLLEVPGTILVLYHCRKRAIVAEAKIIKAASEAGIHKYYFDKFITYPNQVSLNNGSHRRKFKKIPLGGRWWLIYIDEEALDKIRALSGLDKRTRDNLKRDLESVRGEIQELPSFVTSRIFKVEKEIEKLSASGVDQAILDGAKEIFLKVNKARAFQGRSLKIMFYAALYIAYRNVGMTIRLKDISKNEGIDLKKLASAFNLLRSELEITLPKIGLEAWIRYYSNLLKLPEKTIKMAIAIANQSSNNNKLKSRNPHSLSGTAIYIACLRTRVQKKQKEISEISGVSTVTMRNLSKILLD